MLLKHLCLYNFRSFERLELNFEKGINLICGHNAAGKTTILEAISLISIGRSFRTLKLKELISFQKEYFRIEAEVLKNGVEYSLSIYFDGVDKKIVCNSTSLPSFVSLFGIVPSVTFSPFDMQLIFQPLLRRRFFNLYLSQKDPLYVRHLNRFTCAMKERNALLKKKELLTIEAWEGEMAKSASYLMEKRERAAIELKEAMSTFDKEEIEIIYRPSIDKDQYLEEMKKSREKDIKFGITLLGPHRDDFLFLINKKSAKDFASEGQKKSLIGALKLAEWSKLAEDGGAIFSVDDLDAQLDQERKRFFWDHLKKIPQVFITSPRPFMEGEFLISLEKNHLAHTALLS